jgi:hypothetical protein
MFSWKNCGFSVFEVTLQTEVIDSVLGSMDSVLGSMDTRLDGQCTRLDGLMY